MKVLMYIAALYGLYASVGNLAAAESIPLTSENAAKIRTVRVVSSIPQSKLLVEGDPLLQRQWIILLTPASGANVARSIIASALVNALFSEANRRKVEELEAIVARNSNRLPDIDFRKEFWSSAESTFGKGDRFRVIEFVRATDDAKNAEPAAAEADATLTLETIYFLASDLRQLQILTSSSLRMKGAQEEAYRNLHWFASSFVVPTRGTPAAESLDAWLADGAVQLATLVRHGISQSSKMVLYDLLLNNPAGLPPEKYGFDKLPRGGVKAGCANVFEAEGQKTEVTICRQKEGMMTAGSLIPFVVKK